MAPRKGAKTQDAEVSEPAAPPEKTEDGGFNLGNVLAEKVLEQVDITALAAKLAPELADRLMGASTIESLKDRVLELLVIKVAEDPALFEALSVQLLACL